MTDPIQIRPQTNIPPTLQGLAALVQILTSNGCDIGGLEVHYPAKLWHQLCDDLKAEATVRGELIPLRMDFNIPGEILPRTVLLKRVKEAVSILTV